MDRITPVIVALADQPAKNVRRIGRVCNAALWSPSIDRRDIVFRDGTPMDLVVVLARPLLDAGEQTLNPRPISADGKAVAYDVIDNQILILVPNPLPTRIRFERRHEV